LKKNLLQQSEIFSFKMKLRTGKNVPFLNKNIPKRKYTKSYKYKTPISKDAENDLASSFANISLCDNRNPAAEQAVTTPKVERRVIRKSLMFDDSCQSTDEAETMEKYDLSALPFDQNQEPDEIEQKTEEIILYALSSDDEEAEQDNEFEVIKVSSIEEDLIVFSATEESKTNSDDNSSTPDDFSVASDDISDAMPVFDTDDDETDDDDDADEIERMFLNSTPNQLRIGSVISFIQTSMQDVRST